MDFSSGHGLRAPPFSHLTASLLIGKSEIARKDESLKEPATLTTRAPVSIINIKGEISTELRSIDCPQPLPVLYRNDRNHLLFVKDNLNDYVTNQLSVLRLNRVHEHLWLAGRPMSARPLHRQQMMGREIVLTEQADLHLTWRGSRIYAKPIPLFLFDFDFWIQHICPDPNLHALACGLLLSYVWLVCQPSDLKIAIGTGLLPPTITWSNWVSLVSDLTLPSHIDIGALDTVNKRYLYGELRLNRLSKIYRFSPKLRGKYLLRGYQSYDTGYQTFFDRHFAWILVLFVYISIVLTSAQLGLATDKLQQSLAFQRISFGLTMFCIVLPAAFLSLMIVWFIVLFNYNLIETLINQRRVNREREDARRKKRDADG